MNRVIHFEIHAADPERAMAFYQALFGWTFAKWGDFDFWQITTGEGEPGVNGGLVRRHGENPAAGAPVMGSVFSVHVASVDATLARIPAAGGAVALAKQAIPGVGWTAYGLDTEGNVFGLMQEDPQAQ
jgi:predicted enzyme related to lactoylglutathione lyase